MLRPLAVTWFLFIFWTPTFAHAETEVRGRVFYNKLNTKEPSFFFHSLDSVVGEKRVVVTTYTDKDGKELGREENSFEGGKHVRSVYKQLQVNDHGEVFFKDGKAHFTFTNPGGTENESEEIVPNMVVGSMVVPHLLRNWEELMKGDSVYVRYMAIERCETIGFKFFKDRERVVDGKTLVDFKMKPSSFLLSALVDPIRFSITKEEPRRIVEMDGRTPIRWPKSEPPTSRKDWKAIDARIEFDAPKEIPPAILAEPVTDKPSKP